MLFFYEVTTPEIAQEIRDNQAKLQSTIDKFLNFATQQGFTSIACPKGDFLSDWNDFQCLGFIGEKPRGDENWYLAKTNFKENVYLPRKKNTEFNLHVEAELGGLKFNEIYGMGDTWKKLVPTVGYTEANLLPNGLTELPKSDGVKHCICNDKGVYVGIRKQVDATKIALDHLKEISKDDYENSEVTAKELGSYIGIQQESN